MQQPEKGVSVEEGKQVPPHVPMDYLLNPVVFSDLLRVFRNIEEEPNSKVNE